MDGYGAELNDWEKMFQLYCFLVSFIDWLIEWLIGFNKDVQFVVEVQEESGEWVVSKGLFGEKDDSTRMGFEPTRGDPNGVAVHRLNHSATSSLERLFSAAHYNIV